MNKNENSLTCFPIRLDANPKEKLNTEPDLMLEGTWLDIEMLYLANDKKTILEREIICQDEIFNKLSFDKNCMTVSLYLDNFLSINVEQYNKVYTFEDNILTIKNTVLNEVVKIEILCIDEREMWMIADKIVVEDFSKDVESNTMYEVIRFIKC
jgi:hypothetical protein